MHHHGVLLPVLGPLLCHKHSRPFHKLYGAGEVVDSFPVAGLHQFRVEPLPLCLPEQVFQTCLPHHPVLWWWAIPKAFHPGADSPLFHHHNKWINSRAKVSVCSSAAAKYLESLGRELLMSFLKGLFLHCIWNSWWVNCSKRREQEKCTEVLRVLQWPVFVCAQISTGVHSFSRGVFRKQLGGGSSCACMLEVLLLFLRRREHPAGGCPPFALAEGPRCSHCHFSSDSAFVDPPAGAAAPEVMKGKGCHCGILGSVKPPHLTHPSFTSTHAVHPQCFLQEDCVWLGWQRALCWATSFAAFSSRSSGGRALRKAGKSSYLQNIRMSSILWKKICRCFCATAWELCASGGTWIHGSILAAKGLVTVCVQSWTRLEKKSYFQLCLICWFVSGLHPAPFCKFWKESWAV